MRPELKKKPYQPGDAGRMRLFEEMMVTALPNWKEVFDLFAAHGPAFTWYQNGDPVMCAGILMCYERMGEAWLVADQKIRSFPSAAFTEIRNALEEHIEKLQLARVQANTVSTWAGAIHFLEKLGFRKECTMRKAGPRGEDRDLFSRVT